MSSSLFKARAMPRGNRCRVRLPSGRVVTAVNNSGTRVPPNAPVTVLFENGKYSVAGFDR